MYPRLLLFLITILVSPLASAEIYKWVDENGRLHFSDTPPGDGAEEVKVKTQSVDMEGARRSSDRFTRSSPSQRPNQERQARAQATRKKDKCLKMWNQILTISGPVRFLNEDGEEVRVSERERQKREAKLRASYRERCRN